MEHPITPPPELVKQWLSQPRYSSPPQDGTFVVKRCLSLTEDEINSLATQAARWGADQELEACCEWLTRCAAWESEDVQEMRNFRRPQPPSLKKQALKELAWVDKHLKGKAPLSNHCDAIHAIRCALEQLDD